MSEKVKQGVGFELRLGDEHTCLFRECTGMDSETEVVEEAAVDASGRRVVRKVAGATKWSNITLKRGVDQDKMLWDWRAAVVDEGADSARVDGTIVVLDDDGAPVASYRFVQGWPVKYGGASFRAASNDVALEEIVICHEGLTRES